MNIYFVERTDVVGFEQPRSIVCYADDEAKALEVKPTKFIGISDHSAWQKNVLSATLLGTGYGEAGSIISEDHSGL